MLRWIDWVGRIVLAAFGAILIWQFWQWWSPDPPRKYLRSDLINAQEADTFFTGFASLGVVRFRTDDGFQDIADLNLHPQRFDDVKGFCYRLYELSIGYPSIGAAIKNSEASSSGVLVLDEPQVLSANIVQARHGGDSVSTSECDQADMVTERRTNAARLTDLRRLLAKNGQWYTHAAHGQNVLVTFSRTLTGLRKKLASDRLDELKQRRKELLAVQDQDSFSNWAEETKNDPNLSSALEHARAVDPKGFDVAATKKQWNALIDRQMEREREEMASAAGYLGALKLTFATIGIFSQERGRWFWKRDEFYVRQDMAEATYGTDFAQHVAVARRGLFSPYRLEISVPEPRLLAIDRYTTVSVTKANKAFVRKDDADGKAVEDEMRADLEEFMKRITPQAIRFTKSLLTAQLLDLTGSDVAAVDVRFVHDDATVPSQLAELVRLLQQRESSGPPAQTR